MSTIQHLWTSITGWEHQLLLTSKTNLIHIFAKLRGSKTKTTVSSLGERVMPEQPSSFPWSKLPIDVLCNIYLTRGEADRRRITELLCVNKRWNQRMHIYTHTHVVVQTHTLHCTFFSWYRWSKLGSLSRLSQRGVLYSSKWLPERSLPTEGENTVCNHNKLFF